MADINNNNHVAIIINSLGKIYNQARINGVLHTDDLYLLDAINKLLGGCESSLMHKDRMQLISLYNKTLNTSKYLCKDGIKREEHAFKKHFATGGSKGTPIPRNIQYWQENSVTNTIVEILPLIETRTKLTGSYESFAIGKTITYSSIGRICFLLSNETSINYKLVDDIGSDITFAFDLQYVGALKSVLIVSKNIYSHGDVKILIIKNTI